MQPPGYDLMPTQSTSYQIPETDFGFGTSMMRMDPTSVNQNDLRNIYVSSLPNRFSTPELIDLFRAFGTIISARFMTPSGYVRSPQADAESGFRGYGFVCFESSDSAYCAINNMIGVVVGGSRIQVRPSRRHAEGVLAPQPGVLPTPPPPPPSYGFPSSAPPNVSFVPQSGFVAAPPFVSHATYGGYPPVQGVPLGEMQLVPGGMMPQYAPANSYHILMPAAQQQQQVVYQLSYAPDAAFQPLFQSFLPSTPVDASQGIPIQSSMHVAPLQGPPQMFVVGSTPQPTGP